MSDEARVVRYHADALDVIPTLADESVDAVVTDPPYELGFMGRAWDASGIAYNVELWKQCFRVLKSGGHLLAFGGTRTSHRLAVAVEDAGFEIRDSIVWIYGSGFPKSLDVSKAIDKAAGAEREVIGVYVSPENTSGRSNHDDRIGTSTRIGGLNEITAPATDDAKRWAGWGTALKPAHEPIVVARKPLIGTVAANVLAHGTGALNIDATRVETTDDLNGGAYTDGRKGRAMAPGGDHRNVADFGEYVQPAGRWPANVVLDEDAAAELDEQSGMLPRRVGMTQHSSPTNIYGEHKRTSQSTGNPGKADTGGASRFFPVFRYQAKAPTRERVKIDGVAHPTVKPLELMRWLVRLVTPPDGVVLEPFAGSGTTVEACIVEGMRCLAIEREESYLPLIAQRIERAGLVAW